MDSIRNRWTALLVAGGVAVGVTACGGDDASDDAEKFREDVEEAEKSIRKEAEELRKEAQKDGGDVEQKARELEDEARKQGEKLEQEGRELQDELQP